jgi:signal transduction histidine kinase
VTAVDASGLPRSREDALRKARIDVAVTVASVLVLLGIWQWVLRDGWLLFLAAAVLAVAVAPVVTFRQLVRGRPAAGLLVNTGASWGISLVATAVTPVALYMAGMIILTPVVRAIPFLERRQFARVAAGAVAASVALVLVGRLQEGARLEERVPGWVLDAVVMAFVPLLVALTAVDAWRNHLRMRDQAAELRRSRARLVAEADRTRRQIERDLHDGAQQRLVALAIQLQVAQKLVTEDPDRAAILVGRLAREAQEAMDALRDVAHGVYPPELTRDGLRAALTAVALRTGRPTRVEADGLGRFPADIEAAAYFCCLEALQNAVKHAGEEASITIELRRIPAGGDGAGSGPTLVVEVRDDGAGFDPAVAPGHGLVNIADRVGAHGGTVAVDSRPGVGTTIRAALPTPA